MDIGVDARTLVGNRSGVGYYLSNLVEAGAFESHTVYAYYDVSTDGSPADLSVPEQTDLRWRPTDTPTLVNRFLGPASAAWWVNVTLYDALERDDVDAFFGPNFVQPARFSKPSIVVVHDMIHRTFPQAHPRAYRWYLRASLAVSLRRADRILTVSRSAKRDIQRYHQIPSDRITVGYGAAAGAFQPRELSDETARRLQREFDIPEDFLLYVGNIEPRKNLTSLIDALALLDDDDRPPLVIVGKKQLTDEKLATTYQQCSFSDDIHFTGYVPEDDLPLLYNSASLFVFPSLYEGFGLPVLEAMQSGLPVVVSDRSSLPEIVDDAGVVVAPHPKPLSDAIRDVWFDLESREEYRERGKTRAGQFSWDRTATQVATVLDRVSNS
jgi:glycosyltransferase involved in cell wall biosynthesis